MKTKLTTMMAIFITVVTFAQENWKTLKAESYAITYPENWVSSDQKPQPSMLFLLLAEETSQNDDKFRENINLTTEDLAGQTFTIDAYAKLSTDQITAQIPTAKVELSEATKLDGQDAWSVIWSADFGNGMVLKFNQVFLISGGTAYVLTFSSTTTEYDSYIDVAKKVLNSFKLAK